MIVLATADFEVYHEVLSELRKRGIECKTVEPDSPIPPQTELLITGPDDSPNVPGETAVVRAQPGAPREAVERTTEQLRENSGRRIIGIDPGEKPGIAVLDGPVVVATFQVPPEDVADIVARETADAPDPLVRIGDGARLTGARLIDDIDDVPVELVDETGTTPYLGTGTRGIGDVLAAVNIAHIEGKPVESREIEPTEGELRRIQEQSREQSEHNRTIDTELARRVAAGELSIDEALDAHEDR